MSPQLLRSATVKARKHHRCYHCAGWIAPGQSHLSDTLIYDGIYTLRTHLDCDALWSSYFEDSGRRWGDLPDEGIPPIYEEWAASGDSESLRNAYRGHFPGPITRMEFNLQKAGIE